MTGITGGFTNIANLIGGTGTDSFTINGGSLSGAIDGGLTGVNTLTADNPPTPGRSAVRMPVR